MKKVLFLISFFFFGFCYSVFAAFHLLGSIDASDVKQVAVSSFDNSKVYIISGNSFYEKINNVFVKRKNVVDDRMVKIVPDDIVYGTVFLATSRYVYRLSEKTEKIFSIQDDVEIFDIIKFEDMIYIATSQGLYAGIDGVFIFNKVTGLGDIDIYYLTRMDKSIFVGAGTGIYKIGDGKVERVFVIRDAGADGERVDKITFIYADNYNRCIWAGLTNGLMFSCDNGVTWEKFYSNGLNGVKINCIIGSDFEKNVLYLATERGFFRVDTERHIARQIFEGLPTNIINWVELTGDGRIFLATARGLFVNEYFTFSQSSKQLRLIRDSEVPIYEVQQAALKYNEIGPERINKWRKRLKYRAIFPNISVDFDKTITYDSGSDVYYTGPRDWGVSASWDLGDILWNTYEDDIDTRGRLNTQLRIDILDEVNRIYYERIRLRCEILNGDFTDEERFDRELRLQELTAVLDGYTGGSFSKKNRK
ncbi:MAG: hypothetical protein WC214_01275 [Candidatus Omnitrophota bacterium]|nr:hypothetical protein [Candidatus Omnitrophota bacterium]